MAIVYSFNDLVPIGNMLDGDVAEIVSFKTPANFSAGDVIQKHKTDYIFIGQDSNYTTKNLNSCGVMVRILKKGTLIKL